MFNCQCKLFEGWFYTSGNTFKRISAIWLLFYLRIFFVSCLLLDNDFACGPGLNTPGWTVPKGDIILEEGSPLEIFCTLDLSNEITKSRNASFLIFYRGKEIVEPKYVTVLNETTARLNIPSPSLSHDMYYCRLKLGSDDLSGNNSSYVLTSLEASVSSQSFEPAEMSVCLNDVAVGNKPEEVRNFSCISHNWESLECKWESPVNYVKTTYKVYYQTPGRSGRRTMYPCPLSTDALYSTCTWDLHTNPLYRRSFEYLFFTVVGENVFGSVSSSIKYHHFAHIIPAAPSSLKVLDKTISSVYLQWSIGVMSVFEKGLTFRVEYMWNPSHPWNVTVYSHKEVNKTDDRISLNVTGLIYPNIVYDFRVYMKSSVASGENVWSSPTSIIVKTKSCSPYTPPRTDVGSFEISQVYPTHRDIYLYWQPLNRYEQNGEDFHYEVTALDEDNNTVQLKPTTISYSYAKFAYMKLSSYRFLIRSVNKEGLSPPSEIIVPSGTESLQEPLVFTKIDFGDGVYELSWKLPGDLREKIANYTVFWCESNRERPYQCDGYLDWKHLPAHINIHNVTVNISKAYQFAISANSVHSSSGMVWASCTVLHDKVGKMKNVWVNKIGSDFIEVGWKLECSDRVEGIQGYQIFYCPTISPDNSNCKEPEQNITIMGDASTVGGNVTNLKPYTRYKISTTVFTKDGGAGPRSDDLFNHTLDGAPDVTGIKLHVANVTDTQIGVSWEHPVSINGVFQHYEVRYNNDFVRVTNDTKVTLTDLRSFYSYNVAVFACTKLCSQIDKTVRVLTRIGVPGTVGRPTAHKINSTHALVSWNPPVVKAGPHNAYDVLVQRDDSNKNVTVFEFDTNGTEAEVPIPDCKGEFHLSYTFYVRAKNIDYSYPTNYMSYIGDWSPAYSINCINSGISLAFRVLFYMLFAACAAVFVFLGKRSMYKCKKMKQVEVTLPPNFTIPPTMFQETMKEKSYVTLPDISPTWNDCWSSLINNNNNTADNKSDDSGGLFKLEDGGYKMENGGFAMSTGYIALQRLSDIPSCNTTSSGGDSTTTTATNSPQPLPTLNENGYVSHSPPDNVNGGAADEDKDKKCAEMRNSLPVGYCRATLVDTDDLPSIVTTETEKKPPQPISSPFSDYIAISANMTLPDIANVSTYR